MTWTWIYPGRACGMDRRKYLIENLQKFPTKAELYRSEFFSCCGAEIESLLESAELANCPTAAPRLHSFIRAVQWNIEKGTGYEAILRALQSDEIMKWADLLLLNEADCGMRRSGNRHIALCLAEALDMHMVFGPAHLELTKGTGDDLAQDGENEASLQGNAVLSRYPIIEKRVIPLPSCFESFEFHEKRFGRRCCVWARLLVGSNTLWVGSTHLEVRNAPACRARQMGCILDSLPADCREPCLLGGDFNSNGFARGTRRRAFSSLWQLVASSPHVMRERFLHPERGSEPLFRLAGRAGFFWEGLNSSQDTAWAAIGGLEDAVLIPRSVLRLIQHRLEAYGGYLRFKLDWLLGRKLRPLRSGELQDEETGAISHDPGRVLTVISGPERPSDHHPIHADFLLAGEEPPARTGFSHRSEIN